MTTFIPLHFGDTLSHPGSGTSPGYIEVKPSSIFISFGSYIVSSVHWHRRTGDDVCL